MNTKRRLAQVLGVLVALCLMGSLATPALANGVPPPLNHQFFGEVTSQGVPVDEGASVVAKVDGEPCGSTTVYIEGAKSKYSFEVDGKVAFPGDPIEFYVDGVKASLYDVKAGRSLESYPFGPPDYRTELNLMVGEAPTQYALTMAVTGSGSTTPAVGDHTYVVNTVVDITATPDAGWEFGSWTGDVADPDSATTTVTMDGDKTVTATFQETPVEYTLTMAVSGSGTTEPAVGEHSYPAGTVVDISATPDAGWEFDSWTGDVADTSSESTTVTMDAAKTVTATFTEIGVTYYTLTMAVVGEGTVTPDPGTYPEGDMPITATSASGWQFASWATTDMAEIADASSAETTLTLDKDKTVTATFTERLGFTTTLSAGWNLLSTPIKLAADSDAVEQIFDAQSLASIDIFYSWDGVNWVLRTTGYQFSPLEATYVKVKSDASATAEFIPSEKVSWPPSRELPRGLNLIGPAPAFDLKAGVFPAKPLDQALFCIAEAENGLRGYTMVVSPSPSHNQPGWDYAPGGQIRDLLPYKGYWVVMENADTLFGSSTTPIPE